MRELPVPAHFDPDRVGEVWRVPYEDRAREARAWAEEHGIGPRPRTRSASASSRSTSRTRSASRTSSSSSAAAPARARSTTTAGCASSSTATSARSRRSSRASTPTTRCRSSTRSGWSTSRANHPEPYTLVSPEDVASGRWRVNEAVADALGIDRGLRRAALEHYTRRLAEGGKYNLTIWPYHAMLGGIGHALVSAVEEAVFFHGVARYSQPDFQVKGDNPLTEHYSMLGPEVTEGPDGERLGGIEHGADREAARRSTPWWWPGRRRATASRGRSTTCSRTRRASAARRAHLPARGLHVAGGRAGRRRLHRRGGRRLRALRRGRHARGRSRRRRSSNGRFQSVPPDARGGGRDGRARHEGRRRARAALRRPAHRRLHRAARGPEAARRRDLVPGRAPGRPGRGPARDGAARGPGGDRARPRRASSWSARCRRSARS